MTETTKLFNKRFRMSKSTDCIRSLCKRHGLKSGYHLSWNTIFFKKHIEFLKKIVPGRYYAETVKLFNRRFKMSLTAGQIKCVCGRYGISTGLTGGFEKGSIPHNKGKKGVYYAGCERTWFKKGQKPVNTMPIGSTRFLGGHSYVEIKYSDKSGPAKNRWKSKQAFIWEKANGPVPKGHIVIFLDGDKTNFKLNNLFMVSRNEHVRMCQRRLYTSDRKTTLTNLKLAQLSIATTNLKIKTLKAVKNKKIVFLNNNKFKVYVIKEKGRYIPVRETSSGSLVRLRIKSLKSRATRAQAQRDLFEYAEYRRWMRI